MRPIVRLFTRCAALVAIVALAGCGSEITKIIEPNDPPTVRLTAAPPTYANGERYSYSVTLNWTAFDPDGRVDHFLIAVIDLPGVRFTLPDTTIERLASEPNWIRTDRSDTTILFPSTYSRPDTLWADDSHIFLIKAVDNRGAESEIQRRAFFSSTIAPTCRILSPRPSSQTNAFVTPAVLIDWDGDDDDGVFTKKPVKYKYILLSDQTEVRVTQADQDYDLVRRYYGPRNWAGWDSTSADTSIIQFSNLIPQKDYMFVVISFDEAGAFSPVFHRGVNMLKMRVTFAGNNNPTISMFNEFFSYTYPGGSYDPIAPPPINLEVPANTPITFRWSASAVPGSSIRSYRWAVDIQDLNDETPRTDEQTDLAHWSPKNVNVVSATIGPYPGSTQLRKFFIEAEDINGLQSLGVIGFSIVEPEWTRPGGHPRPLLVVKDWRFLVDRKSASSQTCVNVPQALQWPSSSELDTFLFARGGYPWRCYPSNATYGGPDAVSPPGIMKGFDFDTLGTRIGRNDQTVRLSRLAQYRHVVWITDVNGSVYRAEGTAQSPISALTYMTRPNQANTLATYSRLGGKVWTLGGGALEASLWNYDRTNNNGLQPAPGKTYSFDNNELVPGRFLYDVFRWQSEVKPTSGFINITKQLGRNSADPLYASAPARFDYHSAAEGDTMPPARLVLQNFYYEISPVEYLSRPNAYYEDLDPGPGENFASGLDTLYEAAGVSLVPTNVQNPTNFNNVTMTVYPARSLGQAEQAQAIFSGFDIWSYRKSQGRDLVRFVFANLWGLDPNATMRPATPRTAVAAPALSPGAARPGRTETQNPRPVRTGETARTPRTARSGSGRGE